MRTSVLLIDAGHLYAQGGHALYRLRSRSRLVLHAASLLGDLAALVEAHSGATLLRTYWYDGAERGIATEAQQAIGSLPYVKLRLGRLVQGKQKGVDALIYRDLITLTSERAISSAYLLSGDDDLREGVLFAQDRGVRVILLGIRSTDGHTNQSTELGMEVDDRVDLDHQLLKRSLLVAQPDQDVLDPPWMTTTGREDLLRTLGAQFATEWLKSASPSNVAALLSGAPRIPGPLDRELIRTVEAASNADLRDDQVGKRSVRGGFWSAVSKAPTYRPGG